MPSKKTQSKKATPKSKAETSPETTATKTRARKEEGPKMTFAFRLPPDESKLIHKAAGPRGASSFARTVLVAAANGDLKAVQAAIDAGAEAAKGA